MKRKMALILLILVFVILVFSLVSCSRAPLPVTAVTPTPASVETKLSLPPTEPTLLPLTSSTVGQANAGAASVLPVLTVESTMTKPPTQTAASAPDQNQAAPTAAPIQPAIDPACLLGTWEVTNLPTALSAAQQQGGLALQSVEGRAVYTFGADGTLQITYDNLAATLKGIIDNRAVTAVETLNGSALAHYAVQTPTQYVVLSNFGGQGIRVQMAINGQRLAESDLPAWQAFASSASGEGQAPVVSSSRAEVTCGGDTMTLHAVDPVQGPEVQLKRVQ